AVHVCFDVGESGGVVDADVHGFPARAEGASSGTTASDSVSGTVEAAKFLDVEVHELAGMSAAVTVRWFRWPELPEPVQPEPCEYRTHRRDRHVERRRDLGAGPTQPSQSLNLGFDPRWCPG